MNFTAEEIVKKLKELYGDDLVNPDIFPIQFAHQIKMAKRELEWEKKGNKPNES